MAQPQFVVEVPLPKLRRLQARLKGDELYLEPVQSGITKLSLLTERAAREGAPKDTSALARSIQTETKPLFGRIHSPLVYHPIMEAGRRPGGRMPPPAALAGWARRHGYTGSLFVLARSIARRGIKGRFYMKAAAKKANNALPNILREITRGIEARWRRG